MKCIPAYCPDKKDCGIRYQPHESCAILGPNFPTVAMAYDAGAIECVRHSFPPGRFSRISDVPSTALCQVPHYVVFRAENLFFWRPPRTFHRDMTREQVSDSITRIHPIDGAFPWRPAIWRFMSGGASVVALCDFDFCVVNCLVSFFFWVIVLIC